MSSTLWYQNPSYKTVVWQQNHLEKLPKVKTILGTIAEYCGKNKLVPFM